MFFELWQRLTLQRTTDELRESSFQPGPFLAETDNKLCVPFSLEHLTLTFSCRRPGGNHVFHLLNAYEAPGAPHI